VRLSTESYYLGVADHGDTFLPPLGATSWTGVADATGMCAIDELPSDVPLIVTIFLDGDIVKKDLPNLSLRPGETREVEWRAGGGCDVEGTVLDPAENPVEGCTLWVMKAEDDQPRFFEAHDSEKVIRRFRTQANGQYAFHGIGAGRWWIGPAATHNEFDPPAPDAFAALGEIVRIPEGATVQHADLHVFKGLYIRGVVFDPDGNPSPETYVWGGSKVGGGILAGRTGKDGTFAVGPLVPGRCSLLAKGTEAANSERVEAEPGEEGVVLRLQRGGVLRGIVVDAQSGKPCQAEICVALRSTDDPYQWGMRMQSTEEDGTFRADGLGPGIYNLSARAGSQRVGAIQSVVVRPGAETTGLEIKVSPGATLRVRYAGKDGYAQFEAVSGEVCIGGDGIPAGGVAVTDVPSGHILIRYSLPGGPPAKQEVELSVGEEREVVIGGDH
jgi:protocatechuate 3,4-dioxygenase beta subunit